MVRNTSSGAAAIESASECTRSPPPPSTFTDGLPLPKMIVFDLDYTLWPFWVDTHVTPPLKGSEHGMSVRDATGESYKFYTDVAGILRIIRESQIVLGAASRTHAPDLARKMLKLLHVPEAEDSKSAGGPQTTAALTMFDHLEIYPGSKIAHFKSLHKKTSISYDEMLFFDDESRNKNVEELGVVMHLVRDGVSRKEIDAGVQSWRKRKNRTKKESEAE